MTPAITIITTLYNRERFVEAAMRSVLTQSRRDFEYIVYDDGSTDGSLEIAKRLAAADSRIRLIEGNHRGCVGALKEAHRHATGQLIGWVDSDDLLVAGAIERTSEVLEQHPDAGLVYTNHLVINDQGQLASTKPATPVAYAPERLLTDFFTFHFRLFRRELFERCGGIDDSFTASPDYDFCLRASEVASFIHLPEHLYCYRVHDGSISTARRMEQIENSRRAVENALSRRGMAEKWRLHVAIESHFSLVPRTKS